MVNRILRNSRKVLVTSHLHPDGDAVGSMLALAHALEKQGKEVFLYNESCIPKNFFFLPGIEKIQSKVPDYSVFDSACILDCSELSRTGKCRKILKNIPEIINIDHHTTNTGFGTRTVIDTNACATAEIIYRIISDMGFEICIDTAYCIYTGIFTDTGSFRFSNTNKNSFSICTKMVEKGVSPHKVARHIYGRYSLGRIKLINLVLDSIELSENGKIALLVLTKEMFEKTNTSEEDVSDLINYAEHLEDVKIAALIKESVNSRSDLHYYHVSLRSDGTEDVSKIAFSYGGGGHESAAGFSSSLPFKQLKQEMMAIADRI